MKATTILCLMTIISFSGIVAMNEVMSLEQYKAVLATGICKEILEATKSLWPDNTDGIHLHWSGREFQVPGNSKLVADGVTLNDASYRDALHDWFVKQILHPAMYGPAVNINHVFAAIDELSNNCGGIFGIDPRCGTQIEIKCAILAKRFGDNPEEHSRLANELKLPAIYKRHTTNDLINYVGTHSGELSFFGGALPFTMKLHYHRRVIGFIGLIAAACIGCWVGYKSYCADTKEEDDDEQEIDQNNQIKTPHNIM